MAVSIGLMAGTPFSGGASAALGIIGIVKSAVTIGNELVSAAMTVEQSITGLKAQINATEALWKTSKPGGHLNEVTAAVLNKFIGKSQPCLNACKSNLDVAESKLTGMDLKTHDLAKEVKQMMGESKRMSDEFLAEANKRLAKHPNPKALSLYGPHVLANLNKYMLPTNNKVNKLLATILANDTTIKKATEDLKKLKVRYAAIEKARNPNAFVGGAYKALDNILSVADLGLSVLSGNALVTGAKNIAMNVAPVVGSFAYDKITAVVIAGDLKAALL
jgi:hypothetical protein